VNAELHTTAVLLAKGLAVVRAAASATEGGVAADGLSLLSPVTAPCRVVAQAVNYRSHARDTGFGENPPAVFFRKSSASVSGPSDDIVRPVHVRLLDIQLEKGQFYESKSYPTFTPTGPRLVLLDAEDFTRLSGLRLRLWVNGELRQDGTVADVITTSIATEDGALDLGTQRTAVRDAAG